MARRQIIILFKKKILGNNLSVIYNHYYYIWDLIFSRLRVILLIKSFSIKPNIKGNIHLINNESSVIEIQPSCGKIKLYTFRNFYRLMQE